MKERAKKQERHLKLIHLAQQICDVFCIGFGFGFFFCAFELFFGYNIDGFVVLMLLFMCGFGFVGFGMMEVEFKERFKIERDAMMAENIYKGVTKLMRGDLYEKH